MGGYNGQFMLFSAITSLTILMLIVCSLPILFLQYQQQQYLHQIGLPDSQLKALSCCCDDSYPFSSFAF